MAKGNRKNNKRCPVCEAPEAEKYAPFCSKRCSDVDLGRWLGGTYRIPGAPAEPEDLAAAMQDEPDDSGGPDGD